MNRPDNWQQDWQRCVAFHGHACPGLAIGFRAARRGLELLDAGRAPDEELVAVVENDACGVDAVQLLLGCTFGKGNLVYLDHGKQVFSFFERAGGRGVRLALRPGAVALEARQRELMQKDRQGATTAAERAELAALRQQKMTAVLERPAEELFASGPATVALPGPAIVERSERCARCGEPTMPSKMTAHGDQRFCRPCSQAAPGGS